MSNIAASVSNETRDRSLPQAERSPMEARTQENTPIQDHQSNSAQNQGSSGSNNNQIRAKSIGNYILGKTTGEGTFGKVKLATHILTGEKVAIKILEKDRIIDVADVERVAREIYILKFIRHPNIIQLYEIIETPKQLFLVMEYVNGGELFEYIVAKTRVEEREASKFFHQIIAGIEYIHKLKIVHRDLKPENLLLDYNNNIKIIDFGLSNTYGEGELLKTACGSPCYAAPEMIGGKKYNGLQVDIWSCGVILFAIVCGYLPFEDQNTNVLYTKIKNGDYTIPDFISDEGKDLMKNILNTDPTKRYTIEDIRKHPWMNKIDVPRKEGIIVGYHQTPIDMDILRQLDQYNFQFDFVQKCLDANKHNHVTTTYYLLLRKFHQSGGQSSADINSDTFDKSLLMPKATQPKLNNYYSICNEIEGEEENERKAERDRSRKRSADQSQSFMLSEVSLKQRQSKEIAKIYGSLLDSSSRERVPTSSYSSKGSRILKDTTLLENTNDFKRKSVTGKKMFSPARTDARDEKPSKAPEDVFTPSHNYASNPNPQKHSQQLNKSFNNTTLKERLKEIYKMGGDKGMRSKQSRGDSCDESHNGVHQSLNHDLFNDSFKVDMKDINNSFMCQLQPKLRGNSAKNTKKPAVNSIQSTPKKGPRGSHQIEDKTHGGVPREPRVGQRLSVNAHEKSKTHSQSPSKLAQMLPKEPGYSKPRDSSVNALRSKVQSRKNSRPAIQLAANGKAWRPSTNQAASRERGKSIGLGDDSFKVPSSNHETSFNVGSGSFMLNSSFQKNMLDRSFDYNSHQPKAYAVNLNKRVSYGGEGHNKRGRSNNFSPTNVHKKNLQNLLNRSGCIKG